MLNLQGLLDLLNGSVKNGDKVSDEIEKWRQVYYRMSLHIDGACPRFYQLRDNGYQSWIEPYNYYGLQYQAIFNNHLLNKY